VGIRGFGLRERRHAARCAASTLQHGNVPSDAIIQESHLELEAVRDFMVEAGGTASPASGLNDVPEVPEVEESIDLAISVPLKLIVQNMAGDVVVELSPAPQAVTELRGILAKHSALPHAAQRLLIGDRLLEDGDALSLQEPPCAVTCVLLVTLSHPQTSTDLDFVQRVGGGFFGNVWKCTRSSADDVEYAVKKIQKSVINQHSLHQHVQLEFEIHRSLAHSNIVPVHFHFQDEHFYYLGMELCEEGTLFDKLVRQTRFTDDQSKQHFRAVCGATEYLHGLQPQKVVHRDIKPENVLVGPDGTTKLSDFGFANYIPKEEKRHTFCGTLDFLCPEMILGCPHDEKVDIWCLGVMLFEFLAGQPQFRSPSKETTCRKILRGDWSFPAAGFSPEAKDLVSNLCKLKPEERLTAAQAMSHQFLEN